MGFEPEGGVMTDFMTLFVGGLHEYISKYNGSPEVAYLGKHEIDGLRRHCLTLFSPQPKKSACTSGSFCFHGVRIVPVDMDSHIGFGHSFRAISDADS